MKKIMTLIFFVLSTVWASQSLAEGYCRSSSIWGDPACRGASRFQCETDPDCEWAIRNGSCQGRTPYYNMTCAFRSESSCERDSLCRWR